MAGQKIFKTRMQKGGRWVVNRESGIGNESDSWNTHNFRPCLYRFINETIIRIFEMEFWKIPYEV
jgi:hypothetical protein